MSADSAGAVSAAPSAVEAVRRLPADGPVPWRALEIAAFAQHPAVQDGLDPRGRWPRAGCRPWAARRGATALVVLGALVLPVVGLLAMAVRTRYWRGPGDDPFSVDVVSWTYGATALVLAVLLGRLVPVARRRRGVPGPTVPVFAVPGVLAVLTALAAPLRDVAPVYPQLLPVWAVVALGAVGCGVGVLGRGPRAARVAPGPLVVARAAVTRLTDAERAAVVADLTAAVDLLERRGLVRPALAERARAAPLAMLAHDLSNGPG